MINDKEIGEIEQIIGYEFKNKELIKVAFNHISYANENNEHSNEALEFLGDGILNFVIADILYDKELIDEGQMSLIRSKVVSRDPLAREVERLGLLQYLKLGSSFDAQKGMSTKFVSNLYEAVLAAIYKDSNLATVKSFIKRTLLSNLNIPKTRDYKTKLQEIAQGRGQKVSYKIKEVSSNPPSFIAQVYVNDRLRGEGAGSQKKAAEQAAARAALIKLRN